MTLVSAIATGMIRRSDTLDKTLKLFVQIVTERFILLQRRLRRELMLDFLQLELNPSPRSLMETQRP
jgi:hypothetical protein